MLDNKNINDDLMLCMNGPYEGKIINQDLIISPNDTIPFHKFINDQKYIYNNLNVE